MRINCDSDGVIYDLQTYMIELARVFYGETLGYPTAWYLEESWPLSKEQLERMWRTPGLFSQGEPYDGAIEGVHTLIARGHDVRIVTHKHGVGAQPYPMHETITFYREHRLLEYVDLVFPRGDKTTYPADVVIDDKPSLAWAQPQALNILFDQPWNQEIDPLVGYTLFRAGNWTEVLALIAFHQGRLTA